MKKLLIFVLIANAEASFYLSSIFNKGIKSQKIIKNSDTFCSKLPKVCKESKYRSYDGSCNNLNRSWLGTPFNPYKRLLKNTYSDGKYQFPKSVSNKELPNPRTCSLHLNVDIPKPDSVWNIAFMEFGQLIAHDLSLTAGVAQTRKGAVACCSKGLPTILAETDPKCAPIMIPDDDPYNAPEGIKCTNFYRTETTKDGRKCINATKVHEPLSAVTPFLDASFLYGSDLQSAMDMRKGVNGKLKSVKRNGREFMTPDPNPTLSCNADTVTEPCYLAGDVRVNQNPQLALFHNVYLNYHNKIADVFSKINPHWDDERIYQETRRTIIAKYQYMAYYEFLADLIGKDSMIENNLIFPIATGPINDYDSTLDPAMSIECATGANRIFHSEIVGNILMYNADRNISNSIQLSEWYDKPSVCEHGKNYIGLLIGMGTQPQSAMDRFMTNDILNLLFKYRVNNVMGLDLKAIDIKRGRDQGCGTYVQALKHFKLSNPQSFDDFTKFIEPKYVDILKNLYESYLDVDLLSGLSLETILNKARCGPTSQAILMEQLSRTRRSDHFFFENGNGVYPFSLDQLKEIRQSSIAELFCSDPELTHIQKEALKLISPENPLIPCSEIHSFNATPWIEKPDFTSL